MKLRGLFIVKERAKNERSLTLHFPGLCNFWSEIRKVEHRSWAWLALLFLRYLVFPGGMIL